jgi:hypothetical protein
VAAAVGVGVALSLLLQLNQETIDLKVVRLVPDARGNFTEAPSLTALVDDDVVILDLYGSLSMRELARRSFDYLIPGQRRAPRWSCDCEAVPRLDRHSSR